MTNIEETIEEITASEAKFDMASDLAEHLDNYTIACLIHHVIDRIKVVADGVEMPRDLRPYGSWACGGDIHIVFQTEEYSKIETEESDE